MKDTNQVSKLNWPRARPPVNGALSAAHTWHPGDRNFKCLPTGFLSHLLKQLMSSKDSSISLTLTECRMTVAEMLLFWIGLTTF